jgi:hypothetical protein
MLISAHQRINSYHPFSRFSSLFYPVLIEIRQDGAQARDDDEHQEDGHQKSEDNGAGQEIEYLVQIRNTDPICFIGRERPPSLMRSKLTSTRYFYLLTYGTIRL